MDDPVTFLQDHMGLIHLLSRQAAIRYGGDFEEWLGVCYLAAIDAARTFKPDKGYKFSTHCVSTVKWKCNGHYLKEILGKKRRGHTSSWRDGPMSLQSWDGPDKPVVHDDNDWLHKLNEDDQQLVRLLQSGLKQADLANVLNVSRQLVSFRILRLRRRVAKLRSLSNLDLARELAESSP